MSEDIWCRLAVKVPASWVAEDEDDPFLDPSRGERWGEFELAYPDGSPQAALNAVWWGFYGFPQWEARALADGAVVVIMSGDLNYGCLDNDDLTEWRIPFEFHSDAKYEHDAHDVSYDGTEGSTPWEVASSNDRGSVLELSVLKEMRARAIYGNHLPRRAHHWPTWLGLAVAEWMDRADFDLDACDIAHLARHPVYIPEDEDE